MPPPKTIFVNRSAILANIARIASEQHAAALAEKYDFHRERKLSRWVWVPRDLPLLAGKPLSASERKRHQEALRAMEAEGLIVLDTRHVRLATITEGPTDAS